MNQISPVEYNLKIAILVGGMNHYCSEYKAVVVCTRSTITSKPSPYESSLYSINKRGEPFGKKVT